ncbi:MAG: hypothetical protein NTY09_00075 [bacterium]|nr:hypothetical protein [bacterium]
MKKLVFMVVTLTLMMLAFIPVMADDTSDLNYIESVRGEYMDKIVSEGQTMIFDDIRLVEEGSSYSFPLTVGKGDYEIWGVGGRGIQNLNVRIYSANGDLLSENSGTGNYPKLSFSEPVSRSHRVEIEGSEFEPGVSQGYFCVIVIKND